MSFGMIFTIFLIVIFIFATFYAINAFLKYQKDVQLNQFFDNFKSETNKMYQSSYGTKPVTFAFANNVEAICFTKNEEGNMMADLKKGYKEKTVENLDMEKILNGKNQVCAKVVSNKITFTFSKEYGEILVTVNF